MPKKQRIAEHAYGMGHGINVDSPAELGGHNVRREKNGRNKHAQLQDNGQQHDNIAFIDAQSTDKQPQPHSEQTDKNYKKGQADPGPVRLHAEIQAHAHQQRQIDAYGQQRHAHSADGKNKRIDGHFA